MGLRKLNKWLKTKCCGYNLPEIIKSQEWQIKPTDKLCILAPHADDEAIGCGGLLIKYGPQCEVILLTDGTKGGDRSNPETTSATRLQEFQQAMSYFKVANYQLLGAKDGYLIDAYDKFKQLNFEKYDYVIMPHPQDAHKDHIVPQAFFTRLKKENHHITAKAVYFEIWGTMSAPTHYLDISDVVEEKKHAINIYASQTINIDYASRILGLNHYRGIKHHIAYEEDYTFA